LSLNFISFPGFGCSLCASRNQDNHGNPTIYGSRSTPPLSLLELFPPSQIKRNSRTD
jgi:hypothetical protein